MFLYFHSANRRLFFSFSRFTVLASVIAIVLKPGPARDPADSGLEPGRVEEKSGEGKTRCDPADTAG